MELQYYRVQRVDSSVKTCEFNPACHCNGYQRIRCYRCGWNPKVAQKRLDKLVGKECKA